MRNKKLIPIMSAVTGVLVLTVVVLLFTIGPWKKSSDNSSLKNVGRVFILTDKTTGLILMAAAESDLVGDVLGELAGLGFFDTASDGELVTCIGLIESNTYIYTVYLDQEVTDQT